jgi:hypothetical protein
MTTTEWSQVAAAVVGFVIGALVPLASGLLLSYVMYSCCPGSSWEAGSFFLGILAMPIGGAMGMWLAVKRAGRR